MGETTETKRFKANPVELVIFSAVSLIFMGSVYNLFYGGHEFQAAALSSRAADPMGASRSLASTGTQAFLSVDVSCDKAQSERETTASKIRLSGPLCGAGTDGSKVTKTSIVNSANKYAATVFTDVTAGKFSTDYIPLNPGKNSIHLEFQFRDGKSFSQDVSVTKN